MTCDKRIIMRHVPNANFLLMSLSQMLKKSFTKTWQLVGGGGVVVVGGGLRHIHMYISIMFTLFDLFIYI